MRFFIPLITIFLFLTIVSCSEDNSPLDDNIISNEADLNQLNISLNNSIFNTKIDGNKITLTRSLPFGTEEVKLHSTVISYDASIDKNTGDMLKIDESPIEFTVTAQNGVTTNTYSLTFGIKDYPSIVQKHGRLHVEGNKIVDKNNETVSLAGNSFFWSNDGWGAEKFYNADVVSWLKLDWDATIVRAAMGVEDPGGYIENNISNRNRLKIIVDAAIAEGIYVIIDWHSHHAEDNTSEAVSFFSEMAELYGEHDNIIYEIYNEPLNVSWASVIKPYADSVITAIREHDPDNLIVVGSPEWSQRVDQVAANPITNQSNIAYSLHFYSVNHQQWLRDRATQAMNDGIPIFVSEWGSIGYTQNDPETEAWMDWCRDNKLIHLNWSVSDKEEEWSIVKKGTEITNGWAEKDLTEAGRLARRIIREWAE